MTHSINRFLYRRDGARYIVIYRPTEERVGWVQRAAGRWHWTDTYMARSGHRASREDAADAAWCAVRRAR